MDVGLNGANLGTQTTENRQFAMIASGSSAVGPPPSMATPAFAVPLRATTRQHGEMAVIDVSEERRRRRRAGDPRLSEEGRSMLARMTAGDLAHEFQAALDADLASDPILGGRDDSD